MPTRITEGPVRLATPYQLGRWSLRCHAAGMTVGLVPTMGALHRGHLSLVVRALAECDRVAVSIFVNPAQFAPGEDFVSYPRDLETDLDHLGAAGVHAVLTPTVETMYPPGGSTTIHVGGPAGERLEAEHRPGHFDGVALVVAKLLVSARPDRAYFGQKDAQQCAVVRRLAQDLDTGVQVVVCPTVRDDDGLALSSRNAYLSRADRQRALAIPRGLALAAELFEAGERGSEVLTAAVERELQSVGATIDYIAVVDPEPFVEAEKAAPGCQIVVAARIGTTRLIDVLRLGIDEMPRVWGADTT